MIFQSYAQNNWCNTDEHALELLSQNPELLIARDKLEQKIIEHLNSNKSNQALIIPTVVHIVHQFGNENISNEKVEDFIKNISIDYRRLNADTTETREIFKPYAADVNIEFRLAKIDPNGNCTDGIVRVNSELTYQARDEVKALSYWPSDRYFNVWTVATIEGSSGGTTLGYAQFPGFGAWNTYGFVSRADALGGRTATHEAGHCFGLYHTFQSSCGSDCQSSGDNVCDTPPTFESTWTCSFNLNTCDNDATGGDSTNINPYTTDVEDQIENYMSYDDCQNMFTIGQANRMRAAIQSVSQLTNLVSEANIIATGVDTNYNCIPTPIVDFKISEEYLCTKYSATVLNNSYNGGNNMNYVWDIPNAIEISDINEKEPNVRWGETGLYDITLTVSNSSGSGSLTKTGEAKVLNGTPIEPFTESFASLNFPRNDVNDPTKTWFIDGVTNNNTWEKTILASSDEGGTSLMLDIKRTNGLHRLISPMIDLTQSECDELSFDMAYAPRNSSSKEKFRIKVSTNCGRTWKNSDLIYEIEGSEIGPGAALISGDYIPSDNEWTNHVIDISKYKTDDEVLFMFEFETLNGNTAYIDNIIFGCNERLLSPIEEKNNFQFSVFPNPLKQDATLVINTFNQEDIKVSITDLAGKLVGQKTIKNSKNTSTSLSSITGSTLTSGVYFVSIMNNNSIETQKIIVE